MARGPVPLQPSNDSGDTKAAYPHGDKSRKISPPKNTDLGALDPIVMGLDEWRDGHVKEHSSSVQKQSRHLEWIVPILLLAELIVIVMSQEPKARGLWPFIAAMLFSFPVAMTMRAFQLGYAVWGGFIFILMAAAIVQFDREVGGVLAGLSIVLATVFEVRTHAKAQRAEPAGSGIGILTLSLVAVFVAAIYALVNRYEFRTESKNGAMKTLVFDRWTGKEVR